METGTTVAMVSMAMAHNANIKACEAVVNSFDAKGATVDAMRQYADCVDLLYTDPNENVLLRVGLALCFVGAILLPIIISREERLSLGEIFAISLLGFFGTLCAVVLIYFFVFCVALIFGVEL